MKRKVKVEEVKSINVAEINATQYSINNSDLFNNVLQQNVVTVDMSNVTKVDVMKMSRVAFFRKLVLLNENFNSIALYDYRYYDNNSDRSKSQHDNKYECSANACVDKSNTKKEKSKACETCKHYKLAVSYVRARTAKQLADVLKEKSIMQYLCKQHDIKTYLTVAQYCKLVK